MLPDILSGSKQVMYPIGKKAGFDQKVIDWTTEASSKDRHSKSINIFDASSMIGNLRLIKDNHEIELIRKACDISADAHIHAMKNVKGGDNEQLIESLDGVGIKEGEVYKRSTLERVKSELVRSYASNGRYGADVEIDEIVKPRNRIEISIVVDEGTSAKIEKINIIGNEIYTNEELLDGFELSEGSFFSFLSNDNQYSREKLKGDIETLESFYRDRGYLKFSIESSQISLSRDKKLILSLIHISEPTRPERMGY